MSKEKQHREFRKIDRNVELLKVQIYAQHSHAKLTSVLSFIFVFFISFSVLFYTILFGNLGPTPILTWQIGLTALLVFTIGSLVVILWSYTEDFKKISNMIEIVKEGKELPKLEKLGRQRKNGNEAKETRGIESKFV